MTPSAPPSAPPRILRFFDYEELSPGDRSVLKLFQTTARELYRLTPDNNERFVALQKLLEAKDAAVRSCAR